MNNSIHKQDVKKLTSLNSSENLKLGACVPAIILMKGFMQDQDTSQVLLYSKKKYTVPWVLNPKEQAEFSNNPRQVQLF